jgi:hypothetical protein
MRKKVWDEYLLKNRKFRRIEIIHIEEWHRFHGLGIIDKDGCFSDYRNLDIFGTLVVNPFKNYGKSKEVDEHG